MLDRRMMRLRVRARDCARNRRSSVRRDRAPVRAARTAPACREGCSRSRRRRASPRLRRPERGGSGFRPAWTSGCAGRCPRRRCGRTDWRIAFDRARRRKTRRDRTELHPDLALHAIGSRMLGNGRAGKAGRDRRDVAEKVEHPLRRVGDDEIPFDHGLGLEIRNWCRGVACQGRPGLRGRFRACSSGVSEP